MVLGTAGCAPRSKHNGCCQIQLFPFRHFPVAAERGALLEAADLQRAAAASGGVFILGLPRPASSTRAPGSWPGRTLACLPVLPLLLLVQGTTSSAAYRPSTPTTPALS